MTTGDGGRYLGGFSDAGVERRDLEATAFDTGASAAHVAAQKHSAADPRLASRAREQLTIELPEHDPYITVEVGRALLKLILKVRTGTQE